MITFCLTSCNRWNLLEKTLDSFLKLNGYPIERYLLHEDSGNAEIVSKIREKYPFIEILESNRSGLLASIDKLYALVDTPYIFHCEDDWYFSGNKNFMGESVRVLEERPDIHQVWIRKGIPKDWVEPLVINNKYQIVKSPHLGVWSGFSFNPSLRRLKDYQMYFPNGFNIFKDKTTGLSELNCNNHVAKKNYRAALLLNPACEHIGDNFSTWK